MKIKTLATILLVLLCCSPGTHAVAAETNATRAEVMLLELINDLRSHPVQVIEERGYSTSSLVTEIPEMAGLLAQGLQPLNLDEILNVSSRTHLDDMRQQGYYSKESLDGSLPYDRMVASGYHPEYAGEVIAMLGFRNFIDSANAINIMFSRMIEEELNKSSINELTILNPYLEDIGISFDSTTISSGGVFFNSYLAVCDLATHVLSHLERETYKQINLIRRVPLAYATNLGMDLGELFRTNPELEEVLTAEYGPLTINEKLVETARHRSRDILNDSTDWPDREAVLEFLAEQGVKLIQVEERVRMLITVDQSDPLPTTLENLARIFKSELSLEKEERFLLNPDYDLIGLRVTTKSPGEWMTPGEGGTPSQYYTVLLEILLANSGQLDLAAYK